MEWILANKQGSELLNFVNNFGNCLAIIILMEQRCCITILERCNAIDINSIVQRHCLKLKYIFG